MPDIKKARINKELSSFQKFPPKGISLRPKDDDINNLEAEISVLEDTPYEGGIFKLQVQLPDNYPFSPPQLRFTTPVYHPNIDEAGRICLDVLKDTEQGSWKPSMSLSTLLLSIQMLLKEPNPDDPLMPDIAEEFKSQREVFEEKARQHTLQHASTDAHAAKKTAQTRLDGGSKSRVGGGEEEVKKEVVVSKMARKRKMMDEK